MTRQCDFCNNEATKIKKVVFSKNRKDLVGHKNNVCDHCNNNDQNYKDWIFKKEGIVI